MRGSSSAPGKLILVGEHAVVYGHPAIALAVDRHTRVEVELTDAPGLELPEVDARTRAALEAILPPGTRVLSIAGDLPVGRGMGSSASLAVAAVQAVAAARGGQLDPEAAFTAAMPAERVFHGDPSGLDVAIAARGGVIRYRRGPPPELDPLPAPSWGGVVLDTGLSGNTAELVSRVAARRDELEPVLEAIGVLAERATAVLAHPVALGPLLSENHALLRALGVSTPELEDLIALAMEAGALGAKLCGAGGGGVAFALTDRPDDVIEAATRRGITSFAVRPSERP